MACYNRDRCRFPNYSIGRYMHSSMLLLWILVLLQLLFVLEVLRLLRRFLCGEEGQTDEASRRSILSSTSTRIPGSCSDDDWCRVWDCCCGAREARASSIC